MSIKGLSGGGAEYCARTRQDKVSMTYCEQRATLKEAPAKLLLSSNQLLADNYVYTSEFVKLHQILSIEAKVLVLKTKL